MTAARPETLWTRAFVLLSLAHFFQALALHLYVHVPAFLAFLGASELEIGVTFGTTAAVAIAVRPAVGRLMDRRGRRVAILAGSILHPIVCLLYLTVQERGPWLLMVRGLHGLADAILFSSLFTLAADLVPASRRTEGLAIFGISGLLPIALAGLLGDVVLRRAGYRELFLLSAGSAVVALVACAPVRDAVNSHILAGVPARKFWHAALERRLLPLWFIGVVFATCLSAIFVFAKTYLLQTGAGTLGEFLTSYIIAAALLRFFFGWVPDRIGATRALVPAILSLGGGLLLLAHAETRAELALSGVLSGLGHGFTFPILAGLVVARARESERGSAISLFTAIFDFGLLIGGPLFGAVAGAFGYAAMYWSAALACMLGILVYALWERAAQTQRPISP